MEPMTVEKFHSLMNEIEKEDGKSERITLFTRNEDDKDNYIVDVYLDRKLMKSFKQSEHGTDYYDDCPNPCAEMAADAYADALADEVGEELISSMGDGNYD